MFINTSFWDYSLVAHKVTFDPARKIIIVAPDVSEIDIQVDIYSDSKEWIKIRDNSKYTPPVETVGGDLLPSGNPLGRSFFLVNGWQISLDHNVNFAGNIYSRDYASPFVTKENVFLNTSTVSNLVDIAQPTSEDLSAVAESVWDVIKSSPVDDSMADDIKALRRLLTFIMVKG